MSSIKEKRDSVRIDVNCEIYCKLRSTEESHQALCVTLSGSGISFISNHPFEIGADVEVNILPETTSTPRFFITIARCQTTPNGNFEIGASIQLPSETV